jgi:opacity protein-like surface antigen
MQKIKLLTILLIFNQAIFAQVTQILNAVKPTKKFEGTPILQKKSSIINLGFGFPNNATDLLSGGGTVNAISQILGAGNTSTKGKKGFGPVFLGYEYFLNNEISVGLNFLYATGKQDYSNSSLFTQLGLGSADLGTGEINLFQIAGSTSYHLYTTNKLDPYIKGAIGINLWKTTYTDKAGNKSNPFTAPTPFAYQGIVGLRYFVSNNWAILGEVSYSSLRFSANIGTTYKIN